MNKNVSRIAAVFGTTAMLALGTAGIAGAQDALTATTTAPIAEPTSVSVSTDASTDPLAPTDHGSIKGTPKNLVDAEEQADEGGKKLPGYVITDVKLTLLDGKANVLAENLTLDQIKQKLSGKDSYTIQGYYKIKIPDPAKAGDYFDIKFANGAGGTNWKQNIRQVPTSASEKFADISSKDGQTYRVKLIKDACGMEFGFTLNSNINPRKPEEINNFDYTKAEKAPENFDWGHPSCRDATVTATATAPTSTAPTVTGPMVTGPTVTKTAPMVTGAPIIEDEDDDSGSGSTSGGRGGRGGAGGSGTTSGGSNSGSGNGSGSNNSGTPVIMTPGSGSNTGTGASSSDSQTVVSGGGFTDNSKSHIPSWIRSDGGESISVEDDPSVTGEDDEAVGPEVKTGGAAENASFFAKVANLFR